MISFNKQKFAIALICTLLGWSVGFYMGKKRAEEHFSRHYRNQGLSHFWGFQFPGITSSDEPPSLFRRFFKNFGSHPDTPSDDDFDTSEPHEDSIFDRPLSLFNMNMGQPKITTREDSQFVYMEIDLNKLDKNSLSAKVENNMVIIEGNQKSEEGGSSTSSHFYQSFPIPGDTDATKVDMNYENNKLVLKFPKTKSDK